MVTHYYLSIHHNMATKTEGDFNILKHYVSNLLYMYIYIERERDTHRERDLQFGSATTVMLVLTTLVYKLDTLVAFCVLGG